MSENCIDCLFSKDDEITVRIEEMLSGYNHSIPKSMKCVHPNSPFFETLVNDGISCRLFVDSVEYFKMKDRNDSINVLKNKIKKRR